MNLYVIEIKDELLGWCPDTHRVFNEFSYAEDYINNFKDSIRGEYRIAQYLSIESDYK